MVKVIGVRFRTAGKIYFFDPLKFDIKKGDNVIVDAIGEEKEVIVCRIFEKNETELSFPLKAYKPILKKV